MKEQIINNLENPRQLEQLYRDHKAEFRREFNGMYADIKESRIAQAWYERLNFVSDEITWGTGGNLLFVILLSLAAGTLAKLPQIFSFDAEFFYPRNFSFIVFPFLAAYFAREHRASVRTQIIAGIAFLVSACYINLLPGTMRSDTVVLACIHLPLLLWAVLGFVYAGENWKLSNPRLEFLRFNGDLVVMTTLIMIAGGILTAITIGLFSLIGLAIEEFYFEYIAIYGAAAAPIVGTWLVRTNPQLVNKVSPVIAKIFTPLVLAMLVIYLLAVLYTGKDPYNDREFLMVFNLLLIVVMAIILFSIAETERSSSGRVTSFMLLALSVVTVIVNGIALSAILFRISEWGITPNRLAVLGGNVLMLAHLLMVTYQLFRSAIPGNENQGVRNSLAAYLPVYVVWVCLVVFAFPPIFGFR